MNRPIDTLYYQWVANEEDKQIPTVFEEITEMEDAEKFDDLLSVYADAVAALIEGEVAHRALIEEYITQATCDEALQEAGQEEIAQAIQEMEDVQESEQDVTACRNSLDILHTSLVKTFARGE
jgi:hypothetical protein